MALINRFRSLATIALGAGDSFDFIITFFLICSMIDMMTTANDKRLSRATMINKCGNGSAMHRTIIKKIVKKTKIILCVFMVFYLSKKTRAC